MKSNLFIVMEKKQKKIDIFLGGGTIVCVPKAGLFILSDNNLNYTQAQMFCQKLNGSLAHVISEERMNGLAKFLSHKIPRYVGLSNNDNEKIWKNSFGCNLFIFFIYCYFMKL